MPNDARADALADAQSNAHSGAQADACAGARSADARCDARRVLLLGGGSARRLLEVYVRRSLSLSDGAGPRAQRVKTRRKWPVQARRASSDSSAHRLSIQDVLQTTDPPEPPRSRGTPASSRPPAGDTAPSTRTPDPDRRSVLRTFLNWFSNKRSETRTEAPPPEPETRPSEPPRPERRKRSFRTLSFRNQNNKKPPLSPDDVIRLPNAVMVEPSSVYLEKVSEELERMVKEVKSPGGGSDGDFSAAAGASEHPSTAEEVVERMISLLKQHGDAIDEKIKRNSGVHAFLQRLSYSSFQQLADRYLSQIPPPPHRVTNTTHTSTCTTNTSTTSSSSSAPELIQLAFTLDFTASIARLSNQSLTRITGYGNRYLQDRFTHICSAHTQVDGDVEGQCSSDPE
ncbi:serine/arginine repetitive matrix protein 1-like [Astyanax mexicanus]|uniref:Serine/arginine repetitive matrix protein 1-like n=1 Tax=Astyanax mexicanus TaxID=7994 RepID=A0A8T2LGD9_ASTMX|nr:serine/arginine repetitive matrix protein 1-like [Astyanax mexicanus]